MLVTCLFLFNFSKCTNPPQLISFNSIVIIKPMFKNWSQSKSNVHIVTHFKRQTYFGTNVANCQNCRLTSGNVSKHNNTCLFVFLSSSVFKKKTLKNAKMNAESGNPPPYQNTFKEVVVTLSDGNEIAMNKCLNCGFVTRQNSFTKLAHW